MSKKREGGQPFGLAPLSDGHGAHRVDDPECNYQPESRQEPRVSRVRVYIDGFNLYHAIAALKDPTLKWLNYRLLSESLLRDGEILDEVNFFTAILRWDQEKQRRHTNFLAACRAVGVRVHEAKFKRSRKNCVTFNRECNFYEEKQTDVAIAIKVVSDAMRGDFDRAILMTADSDQIPTARFVAELPDRQLSLVFPPGRKAMARELSAIVQDRRELTMGHLMTCRLPRTVTDAAGRTVATMPALYRSEDSN